MVVYYLENGHAFTGEVDSSTSIN